MSNPDETDTDGDGPGDACEASVYGTVPSNADTDGDGCPDGGEVRTPTYTHQRGATVTRSLHGTSTMCHRLALRAGDTSGTRSRSVTISDVIPIMAYIETSDGGGPNGMALTYNSDWNGNGVADGREYDRTAASDPSEPWRSGPPNGVVSLADAIVALQQVGDTCAR